MTTESFITNANMPAAPPTITGSVMPSGGAARKAAIHKVAVEFQSLFVEMMLKSMRETVSQDKLTGGGHGEEVYGSLLDREYAMAVSRRGGLGLAEMIERQLLAREGGSGTVTNGSVGISRDEKTSKSDKIEVFHENQQ
ncbi:MAG TPA: rod-binding protein [Geobacteraceae bacterium]|nr:rod-binding protein [Geobacteraceae bacterium]